MPPSEWWALAVGAADFSSNGLLLAGAILAGMIAALVYAGLAVWRGPNPPSPGLPLQRYAFPLLSMAGLGVTGYLSYVEVGLARAVCGPIGDCNLVQNSPYARLLGIPLGIVGLAGYAVILGAWLWQRRASSYSSQSPLIIFCAALFGVLLSIYLTCVEIFVLRTVCIWCLTSAVIVTLILVFSARSGPLSQANPPAESQTVKE